MKLNRYGDLGKFITDPDKLVLNNDEVIMSDYRDYCITFDMEDAPYGFEELRGFIAELAKDICELDNTVQKFACHEGETMTDYELSDVRLDRNHNVYLVYYGTKVANVCEVMFERKNGKENPNKNLLLGKLVDFIKELNQVDAFGEGKYCRILSVT